MLKVSNSNFNLLKVLPKVAFGIWDTNLKPLTKQNKIFRKFIKINSAQRQEV